MQYCYGDPTCHFFNMRGGVVWCSLVWLCLREASDERNRPLRVERRQDRHKRDVEVTYTSASPGWSLIQNGSEQIVSVAWGLGDG